MRTAVKFAFLLAIAGCCKAGDSLIICGEQRPPYAYLDQGRLAGIDVEVAKAVFGQLQVPISFVIEPFARCQAALKQGAADVGMAITNKLDRESYVYFPRNYVWQSSFVFFTSKATLARYTIRSLDEARQHKLRIGIIRGASYHETFWAAFPGEDPASNEGYNKALIPAADTVSNLRQLDLEHIQLFPQDRVAGLWEAKRSGRAAPLYYETVLFSKAHLNAFSKASRFKSDAYQDIEALMRAYDAKLAEFKATDRYRALFADIQ